MKVSRDWLQKYFEAQLPSVEEISDALTFHAFEIEEVLSSDLIDVNVLPDRAADCLCHRGIAREIGAVLNVPVLGDPLRDPVHALPTTHALQVSIEDDTKCPRYMGALIRNVKVGPSPAWLKEALEAVGQRSINNVVDATNYVMLDIGQPLHAFDAARLQEKEGVYSIRVRGAKEGEKITSLTGEEYVLPKDTLLITDGHTEQGIGIAGVKGGKAAGISDTTKDIIIESANFDGTSVRKTAQQIKLWTDASQRFQNKISPELAAYGMREVLELIQQVAGGELEGVVDVYPEVVEIMPVSVSLDRVNGLLGSSYTASEVEEVFDRLEFSYTSENEVFTVAPPFERQDLTIPQALTEEVGRILGYEKIVPESLPELDQKPDQSRYNGIERIKDFLTERGFTEISTQTFAVAGETSLANPLDQTRPALRADLAQNMREALLRASTVAPRVLGPATEVKLFEIGTVFKKDSEHLSLVLGYKQLVGKQSATLLAEVVSQIGSELIGVFAEKPHTIDSEIVEAMLTDTNLELIGADYTPRKVRLGAYKPFSIYPFALRDIAVWTPERTEEDEVANILIAEATKGESKGVTLARIDLFDRFSKVVEGKERVSFAFRLVFESYERTLSDEDLNPLIDVITNSLNAKDGWEVR